MILKAINMYNIIKKKKEKKKNLLKNEITVFNRDISLKKQVNDDTSSAMFDNSYIFLN